MVWLKFYIFITVITIYNNENGEYCDIDGSHKNQGRQDQDALYTYYSDIRHVIHSPRESTTQAYIVATTQLVNPGRWYIIIAAASKTNSRASSSNS